MGLDDGARGSGSQDVAIVGMGCVFPNAPDLATFWRNIVRKVDAIGDPAPGSLMDNAHDPDAGSNDRVYTKRAGYLHELPPFSASRFGIMPKAVDGAEPEHFVALHVAHQALEDAGFPEKPFNRERTEIVLGRGTFVNRGWMTQLQHTLFVDQTIQVLQQLLPSLSPDDLALLKGALKENLPPFNSDTASGLAHSVMAGIIANRLNMRGPAYVLDAACASCLIALEAAVQDLVLGKCDAAVCGGVQLSTTLPIHMIFAQLGATSRRGQLRAFDQKADGTLLGEGIGMIVLKRLEDALRDGHRIYALIKGVGSSSDGKGTGLLAPSASGEELAMKRAYLAAGVDPSSVSLVEAHGTGIPLGDRVEVEAMSRVFAPHESGGPRIALGSIKTMIGHLIPAAGIAGIIKAALALYHKTLPPTLHCEDPVADLEKTPLYVNSETRPWICHLPGLPRRAAVSAFGFGGINAHAVLEEAPVLNGDQDRVVDPEWGSELCVISASSRQELLEKCRHIHEILNEKRGISLLDAALAFAVEKPGACRLAIVARSLDDLTAKVQRAAERLQDSKRMRIQDRKGIFFFQDPLGPKGKVAFLFPGEGSQYVNMLRELCLAFPVVRSSFDLLEQAYERLKEPVLPSFSLFPIHEKYRKDAESRLWEMDLAVNSVVTADRGLYRLFKELRVPMDGVVGHSSGELAALEAAGAIVLDGDEELLDHICFGTQQLKELMGARTGDGRLIAVGAADADHIRNVVERSGGKIFEAMNNCPHQVILGGENDAVAAAKEALKALGAVCQDLPFFRAYHTPLFEKALAPLERFFGRLRYGRPAVPVYSCMTAEPLPSDPDQIRQCALMQWARPVAFQRTIQTMYEDGYRIFVETGPNTHLTGFVNDILKDRKVAYVAVPVNRAGESDLFQLQWALGMLAAHHVPMDLDVLFRRRRSAQRTWEELIRDAGNISRVKGMQIEKELPLQSLSGDVVSDVRRVLEGGRRDPGDSSDSHRKDSPGSPHLERNKDDFSQRSMSGPAMRPSVPTEVHGERVIREYLTTMEAFLESQREVMLNFLGRGGHTGAKIERLKSEVREQISQETAEPRREKPSAHEDDCRVRADAFREETVQPEPHTEGRTEGVDTSGPAEDLAPAQIEQYVLQEISERTGYPMDVLDRDQQFEADLGIDSIKRVEIVGRILRRLPHAKAFVEKLNEAKTIGELVTFLIQADTKVGDDEVNANTHSHSVPGDGGGRGEAVDPPIPEKMPPLWEGGRLKHHEPGRSLCVERVVSLETDAYLLHHTLGGNVSQKDPARMALAVMPLAVSLEFCAEAAAWLVPGGVVKGFEGVQAYRWIAFPQGQCLLKAEATREEGGHRVSVVLRCSQGFDDKPWEAVRATVVLGELPESPSKCDLFQVKDPREPSLAGEKIYGEVLFHGPLFQVLQDVEKFGGNGMDVSVRWEGTRILFGDARDSRLLTHPVLLDCAGQTVGLWALNSLEENPIIFPTGIREVKLYGRPDHFPSRLRCSVQTHLDGMDIVSTVRLVDESGRLWMQMEGLQHRRIRMPLLFYRFRGSRDVFLTSPWNAPLIACQEKRGLMCVKLDAIPWEFWGLDGGIWSMVLAHIALSPQERSAWYAMEGGARRKTEWLLGRLAAKEAIRRLVREVYGDDFWLADLTLETEEKGRVVVGDGPLKTPRPPVVSISHSKGVVAALAGDGVVWKSVGLDVEVLKGKTPQGEDLMFSKDEIALAASWGLVDEEATLRFWCAKEAAAKMIGSGLMRGPRSISVEQVDEDSGRLGLQVGGRGETVCATQRTLNVFTLRDADVVAAVALREKGSANG